MPNKFSINNLKIIQLFIILRLGLGLLILKIIYNPKHSNLIISCIKFKELFNNVYLNDSNPTNSQI